MQCVQLTTQCSSLEKQHPAYAGTFHERAQFFLKTWICGIGSLVKYTPRGSAANMYDPTQGATQAAAFLAALYGSYVAPSSGAKSRKYLCWARSQTRYRICPSLSLRVRHKTMC